MPVSTDQIKKLRNETKAALMDVKKAKKWLAKKGLSRAAKKADRETGEGVVSAYIHNGGRVGALIKLACETDFVAKTEDFTKLAYEIGMQAASMSPKDLKELKAQAYIRDPKKTIEDLIKEAVAKLGENIQLVEYVRMEI